MEKNDNTEESVFVGRPASHPLSPAAGSGDKYVKNRLFVRDVQPLTEWKEVL